MRTGYTCLYMVYTANETMDSPEINPHPYGQMTFDRVLGPFNGKRTVFLTNGAETIEYKH